MGKLCFAAMKAVGKRFEYVVLWKNKTMEQEQRLHCPIGDPMGLYCWAYRMIGTTYMEELLSKWAEQYEYEIWGRVYEGGLFIRAVGEKCGWFID